MIRTVRAADARPLILHTPDRNEVVAGPDGAFATTYAPYRSRFLELADSLAVPVLNLPARWRGADEAYWYFRDGVHLSTIVNEVVGGVVERRVLQLPRSDSC